MNRGGHLLALAGLAALLLFLGLGTLGLTDRDEGSNAEAAREMVETGDWITPTLNYEPRFAKPAFVYWLMSGAYRLLGVNEFAARLPSALFGVLLIVLQYLFLTRERSEGAGLFGALMLLLNIEMIAVGRLALTDSVLVFWTTLSLYAFWTGLHGEGRWRHAMWLFYVGMAFGTLTKGPVGLLVPILAVASYLTITRRWRQFWMRGFPLPGLALLVLIAVPWYAAMWMIHGARYTASAQADTVGRFFNVIGGHGGTIFFYIPILLFGFFPWSAFLPAALYQVWKDWRASRPAELADGMREPAPYELELFAACWLVVVFVFFSLSATRLPHYIAPLYPAAALLTASYWVRILTNPLTPGVRGSFRLMMGLGYLLGFVLAAGPALYETFVDKIAKEFPVATSVQPGVQLAALGFVLIAGIAAVGYFGLSPQRMPAAFWAAAATIGLIILMAIQLTLPWFSRYFVSPPQELAYAAGVNLTPQDRLLYYGPPRPSVIFYARRTVYMVKPGQDALIRSYFDQPGRTMIILPARLKPTLPAEAQEFPVILERHGYTLLASKPIVEIPRSLESAPRGHSAVPSRETPIPNPHR